jgi:hypothetical protein
MELRYMLTELSAEPRHIVDGVRDARAALRHLFAALRTLRRDGNTVHIASQLHLWSGLRHTN